MYYVDICRHIKTNGLQCKGVALTGSAFCYFHTGLHQRHAAYRFTAATQGYLLPGQHIQLGALEDRESVQVAISQVINALATGHLDNKRAMALLYGLQLASSNAARLHLEPHPPKAMREVFHEPEGSASAGLDLAEPGAVYKFDADPEPVELDEQDEDDEEDNEDEDIDDESAEIDLQAQAEPIINSIHAAPDLDRSTVIRANGNDHLGTTWNSPPAQGHANGYPTANLDPVTAPSAKGATHTSLGRRPRYKCPEGGGLKARHITPPFPAPTRAHHRLGSTACLLTRAAICHGLQTSRRPQRQRRNTYQPRPKRGPRRACSVGCEGLGANAQKAEG